MSGTARGGGASTDPSRRPKPAKLTPRSFKDIPEGRPAKALGECLRTMLREQDILPDWMTRTGVAKNTITTTMDGRYKGWPSIEKWLAVFIDERVGGTYTQQQYDNIRELHEEGRRNHEDNLKKGAKPAQKRKPRRTEQVTPAPVPGPSPAPVAPGRFRASSASLYAKLPQREPGMRINVAEGVFLDDQEAQERETALQREAQRRAQEAWKRRAQTLADAPPGHRRYLGRAIVAQATPYQPLTTAEVIMHAHKQWRGILYSSHSREHKIRLRMRQRYLNTLDGSKELCPPPLFIGPSIDSDPGHRTPLPPPRRPETPRYTPPVRLRTLRTPRNWTGLPPIPVTAGLVLLLTGLFAGSGYVMLDQFVGWRWVTSLAGVLS